MNFLFVPDYLLDLNWWWNTTENTCTVVVLGYIGLKIYYHYFEKD